MLPDSSMLVHYVCTVLDRLLAGLQIDEERMLHNLRSSHGLVFSQPVLLALVAGGKTRDEAYRIVQRNAMAAWDEGRPISGRCSSRPEVTLDKAALDEAFDLRRSLDGGRTRARIDDIDRRPSGARAGRDRRRG